MRSCRALCSVSATSPVLSIPAHPCCLWVGMQPRELVRMGEGQFPFLVLANAGLAGKALPGQGHDQPPVPVSPPGDSYGVLPRPCRALVLLNPQSGSGRALDDFQAVVQPMLAEADITTTVFVTGESISSSSSFSLPWDPTWALPHGDGLLQGPLALCISTALDPAGCCT